MSLAEGFFTKLEQVRQRPEAERRRWLWLSTIAGTLLIVGIWVLNAKLVAWSEGGSTKVVEIAGPQSSWTQQVSDVGAKISLGWRTITERFTK